MKRDNDKKTKKRGQIKASSYTYRDLKKQAVSLGMPFPDACAADFNGLASWVNKTTNKPDPNLITEYDKWMDKQLEEAGYDKDDPMRSYQLCLGYIGEEDTTSRSVKEPKATTKKESKRSRIKDERGFVKGSKKAYVMELLSRGYDLERVTRRVLAKFPEANKKSISTWYRQGKKKLAKENA